MGANEYYCNDCKQLRLNLANRTTCGNCGSSNIIFGAVGTLNKPLQRIHIYKSKEEAEKVFNDRIKPLQAEIKKSVGKYFVYAHNESGCAWLSTSWEDDGDGLVVPLLIEVDLQEAMNLLDKLEKEKYQVTRYLQREEKEKGGHIINELCPKCNNHLASGNKTIYCSYIKCNYRRKKC